MASTHVGYMYPLNSHSVNLCGFSIFLSVAVVMCDVHVAELCYNAALVRICVIDKENCSYSQHSKHRCLVLRRLCCHFHSVIPTL